MLLSTTFCMLVKILPSLTSTKAKFFCSLIVRTHPMMMIMMMMNDGDDDNDDDRGNDYNDVNKDYNSSLLRR